MMRIIMPVERAAGFNVRSVWTPLQAVQRLRYGGHGEEEKWRVLTTS